MTKIEGRKDDSLLSTYGFRGFPSMAILDASGEAITKSVKRDLPSMKTAVNAAGAYVKLKAKVDAGEQYDKKAWFLAQMGLGMLSPDEAKGCAAELGLKGAEAKEVDGAILALELNGLMRKRGANPSEQIYKWFKAGRRLNKGAGERIFFDGALNQAAIKNDDAEAFKFSVANAKKGITQGAASWKSRLPRFERDLERFKDNARILPQVERAIKTAKRAIKQSEKQLATIEAFAKKIAEKGTGN